MFTGKEIKSSKSLIVSCADFLIRPGLDCSWHGWQLMLCRGEWTVSNLPSRQIVSKQFSQHTPYGQKVIGLTSIAMVAKQLAQLSEDLVVHGSIPAAYFYDWWDVMALMPWSSADVNNHRTGKKGLHCLMVN